MKKMRSQSFLLLGVLVLLCFEKSSVFRVVEGAGTAVADECSDKIQKLMDCLNYATGKANAPTKTCCSSVKDIKESDPKCLCYIMQQTHNGTEQIKSLGIQEARLLQLPSACQLQNASLSYCPKLLGISPTSPDAAIFTNTSTPATPAATTAISAPDQSGNSNGIGVQHGPHLAASLVIAMAIFVYAFPIGSTSMLCTYQ